MFDNSVFVTGYRYELVASLNRYSYAFTCICFDFNDNLTSLYKQSTMVVTIVVSKKYTIEKEVK